MFFEAHQRGDDKDTEDYHHQNNLNNQNNLSL